MTGSHTDAQDRDARIATVAARLDPFIEDLVALQRLPGLAVGVVRDETLVYARGFGTLRIGSDAAVTTDTLFHMASVTKPVVATAIMQLVEAGAVTLDAPVTRYLPYFAMADPRARTISIEQLLSHRSGLPDVEDYAWDRPQHDTDALERYVRSLSDRTLLADPGQHFAYSNIAYEILGDVIAKVSRTTFEDFVQRRILDPLGMNYSTLAVADVEQSLVARGHTLGPDGEVIEREVYPYNRAHAPSSTLVSSIRDLSQWAAMLLNQGQHNGIRIVSAATLKQMWTPLVSVHPKLSMQVGLSWFLERYRGHRIVQHSGSDEGFQSHLLVAPEARIASFAMCNVDFQHVFAPHVVTSAVLELLLGAQPA